MRRHSNRHATFFIALLLIAVLSSAPLFSETVPDWGGFVDSSTSFVNTPDAEVDQELKSGLWFSTRFSDAFRLHSQVSYRYDEDRPFFADVDSLYAGGRILFGPEEERSALMRYRAGRFRFEDFSGYVLDHNLDGLRFEFAHPAFSLETGVGYTGLTFIPSSDIIVTQSDRFLQSEVPDDGYELTSPKVIETAELTFPGLLLGQELVLSGVFQQDLQPNSDQITEDDRIHTQHVGLGLRGGIIPSLYQDVFFYLNLGQGKYETLAYLFGGGLRYYNEDLLYSRIELNGFFSSGDKDQTSFYSGYTGSGSSNHFIALSSSPELGTVYSPKVGNLSTVELSYSLRPLAGTGVRSVEKFQTELGGLLYFRNTSGSISEGNTNPDSSQSYLGTEVDLTLNFRPFSDLGISLSSGLFFPNDDGKKSALLESEESVETAVRLDVSFSF